MAVKKKKANLKSVNNKCIYLCFSITEDIIKICNDENSVNNCTKYVSELSQKENVLSF